jgi:hypothetical protein
MGGRTRLTASPTRTAIADAQTRAAAEPKKIGQREELAPASERVAS